MPYRLLANESVQDGVRRIAGEQIERAIAELQDSDLSRGKAVHQVRKRCKKIRGVLRLVRPALGDRYGKENAWYQRTARSLSVIRDATAMVQTYDAVLRYGAEHVDGRVMAPIGRRLRHREEVLLADGDGVGTLLEAVENGLVQGRERMVAWTVSDDGFAAVSGGLRKTYARARKAMWAIRQEPLPDNYHEWRKRVKYHWYHTRLLRDIWPAVIRARRDETDRLGEMLGDHHNLSVLRDLLLGEPEAFAKEEAVVTFTGLIDRRLREIQTSVEPIGRRLFAEKPKRFVNRLRDYWDVWRKG
jgi:hypothetical protein